MTGCRHGAKNTLVKNYLALAEQGGAQIHPLTTVTGVRPLPDGGYAVDTVRTGKWSPPARLDVHRRRTSCSRPGRTARRRCCTGCARRRCPTSRRASGT